MKRLLCGVKGSVEYSRHTKAIEVKCVNAFVVSSTEDSNINLKIHRGHVC